MAAERSLPLLVGCDFDLSASMPTSAVLQVAPHGEHPTSIDAERWDGLGDHHRFLDEHSNHCERFTVPSGPSRITYRAEVRVVDQRDEVDLEAVESPPEDLDDHLLQWVLPSRFCLPDELGSVAWDTFGGVAPGWSRVQAICDHVHGHLDYVIGSSNPWTTATDVHRSGQGVCRDYAHLAITFCRALNIPARYVFGYLPDLGEGPVDDPMDFAAWFEVHLSGRWHTFDARVNEPRTGRVVVGRGRDAVDVAMLTTFGPVELVGLSVTAEPVT